MQVYALADCNKEARKGMHAHKWTKTGATPFFFLKVEQAGASRGRNRQASAQRTEHLSETQEPE